MENKYIAGGVVGAALLVIVGAGYFAWKNQAPHQAGEVPAATAQSVVSALPGQGRGVHRFYQERDQTVAWLDQDGQLSPDGRAVLTVLSHADDQGLPAARYRVPVLGAHPNADQRARFDVALTEAALVYAHDMRFGLLDPQKLFPDVSLPAVRDDVVADLVAARQQDNAAVYLRGLEPQAAIYPRLKTALQRYRALASRPWPQVTASGNTLAARLQAEGWLDGQNQTDIAGALKRYQTANGLQPSGKLDDKTLAALNISPAERAAQIAVNMERWRWLPSELGQRYIMVNVAAASLVLVENGDVSINSRVVVGAPDKPTPILATQAVAVTINPVWHVPKSIVEKEIKPKLAQNASYLDDKGMVEKDGDIIQPAGPMNALGAAKFEMPNPFDVYLHDTPAKHAFVSDERALSHGCVRVEQIRPLAEKALDISDDELAQLIDSGETLRKPLHDTIPVFIQYWTAVAADNGIGFQPDVYGRDNTMIAALQAVTAPQYVAQR